MGPGVLDKNKSCYFGVRQIYLPTGSGAFPAKFHLTPLSPGCKGDSASLSGRADPSAYLLCKAKGL